MGKSKPIFQKRHYEALATILQSRAAETETGAECRDRLICAMSEMFAQDNPEFSRSRFRGACAPGANVRAKNPTPRGLK